MIDDLRKRPPASRARSLDALLALGFRPFFLAAAAAAVLLVPLWLCVREGLLTLPTTLPASAWHAHEMTFGVVGAVLAGFLLTAARNWTSRPTPSGAGLAALAALWALGRVAMLLDGTLPHALVATVDLAFVPAIAIAIAVPIVRARNWRNLGFVVLLSLLGAANALFHFGGADARSRASRLAVDVVLLVVVLMGGRVIPTFTENALKVTARTSRPLAWACLASTAMVTVLDALGATRASAIAAMVAGVLNGARMLGWRGERTLGTPLLWALHAGYAWIAIGLVLTGVAAFVPRWPPTAPLHALTVGAIGMLILGMMSRVSLGHTGRLLEAPRSIALAFGLLLVAAVVRGLGPLVVPAAYGTELWVSGMLWTLAFAIFGARYFPILSAPRVDGRPG